ncbi:NACHT domain-containing protein [Mariniphaga sediminis]|nr:NACHT domain-containing protein [Mariniphaga sediminis]
MNDNNIIKFDKIRKKFTNRNFLINTNSSDFINKLNSFIEANYNWSRQIKFNDLNGSKNISNIYVDLDLYLTPLKFHVDSSEKNKRKPLIELIEKSRSNLIILGQPGAGKTTSMKKVLHNYSSENKGHKYNLPFLVKLRELKDYDNSIVSFFLKKLELDISIRTQLETIIEEKINEKIIQKTIKKEKIENYSFKDNYRTLLNIFIEFLNAFNVLLILDGYDEITEHREKLIDEIIELSHSLKSSRFVLTSRTSDFNLNIDNSGIFEICSLNPSQLKEFAEKWLRDNNKSNDFLKKIKESPYYDTAIRPLTLSHLCAIYERIGTIPEKPRTIHRKVVALLIEEWDEQRQVIRNSKYINFEPDRKLDFLANIAFILTYKYQENIFTKEQLQDIYTSIYESFDLPKNDIKTVIREIETHTGIILCVSQNQYEFAHKSTQEYLAAEHLVRLPNIPSSLKLLLKLPNELALTVALSSSSSLYLNALLIERVYPICKSFFKDPEGLRRLSFKNAKFAPKFGVRKEELESFLHTFCYRILIEKTDFPKVPLTTVLFLFINSLLCHNHATLSVINRVLKTYCNYDKIRNYYVKNDTSRSGFIYLEKKTNISSANYDLPDFLVLSKSQLELINYV